MLGIQAPCPIYANHDYDPGRLLHRRITVRVNHHRNINIVEMPLLGQFALAAE